MEACINHTIDDFLKWVPEISNQPIEIAVLAGIPSLREE